MERMDGAAPEGGERRKDLDPAARASEMLDRIRTNEAVAALFDIWRSACVGGLAKRTAIDPIDLARAGLLPNLWVVEATEDGLYRYRLAGERIREALQIRLNGRHLEEVFPPGVARFVGRRYGRIIGEACVEYSVGGFLRREDEWRAAERLVLPLADEAGRSAFAIGIAEEAGFKRMARSDDDPEANYAFLDALPWQHLVPGGP